MEDRKEDIGENRMLKMLMADIEKIPVLAKGEEYLIAKRAQAGSEDALKRLVEANLRFVIKLAFKYWRVWYPLMDLISAGYLGLIMAVKTYDPDKGFRFITYAGFSIEHRIIAFIKDYKYHSLLSLDEPIYAEDEECTLKDLLASDSRGSDDRYFDLQVTDLLDNLNERERKVVELRFWNDRTLDEVGSYIGVQKERIRQIEARALRKLRWIIYDTANKNDWCGADSQHLSKVVANK